MDDVSFNLHGVNGDGSARLGSDEQMIAVFYRASVLNEAKSRAAGSPVYDAVDHVKIFQPGEKDIVDRAVKQEYIQRFPRQWDAYKQNQEQVAEGTPLELLFPGNPEITATLRATHVQTVQQLAGLSDTQAQNLQFGDDLRKKAKTYLDGAEKGKGFHALEKQNADLAAKIAELEDLVKSLQAAQNQKEAA